MARESKRHRDAKRFGRPERFIDSVADSKRWEVTTMLAPLLDTKDGLAQLEQMRKHALSQLGRATPVLAYNVAEYMFAQCEQEEWTAEKDFPNCAPPFETMWIECKRPSLIRSGSHVGPADRAPEYWGWLVTPLPVDDEAKFLLGPTLKWFTAWTLFLMSPTGNVLPHVAIFSLPVDDRGQIIGKPLVFIPGGDVLGDQGKPMIDTCWSLAMPALLSLSFMNCKNVTVATHDPDPIINRLRKKNGLRPFVRYHTINIEPMRKVLRDEGGSETHGLKRALHICRGHFATYATSFMGRTLDNPVTVWRPSHVRGSAKEGVVLSDYSVNPAEN